MLRDPDGAIWSDALLLRLWNDEQDDLQMVLGHLEDVRVVQVPSQFEMAYTQDFEWAFSDHDDGDVRLVGYYDDYSDETVSNIWELQHNRDLTPDTTSLGTFCPHPWEAWVDTPNEPPPVHFPDGFHEALLVCFDKDPLDPLSLRDVQKTDPSWRQRQGSTFGYYRDEEYEDRAYLYPKPSDISWPTSDENEEGTPDSHDTNVDTLDVDDNLLVVFRKRAQEISEDSQISDFPEFFIKYIEAGVIAAAYRMNTDGRIESLADYWDIRKQMGAIVIKRYLSKRHQDRVYVMGEICDTPRRHRHPRLPDEYPAVNP
jgi:hypothetical protein